MVKCKIVKEGNQAEMTPEFLDFLRLQLFRKFYATDIKNIIIIKRSCIDF